MTGGGETLVNVQLAGGTGEALPTATGEGVPLFQAGPFVLAGLGLTGPGPGPSTGRALVGRKAGAGKGARPRVLAGPTILTGVGGAV